MAKNPLSLTMLTPPSVLLPSSLSEAIQRDSASSSTDTASTGSSSSASSLIQRKATVISMLSNWRAGKASGQTQEGLELSKSKYTFVKGNDGNSVAAKEGRGGSLKGKVILLTAGDVSILGTTNKDGGFKEKSTVRLALDNGVTVKGTILGDSLNGDGYVRTSSGCRIYGKFKNGEFTANAKQGKEGKNILQAALKTASPGGLVDLVNSIPPPPSTLPPPPPPVATTTVAAVPPATVAVTTSTTTRPTPAVATPASTSTTGATGATGATGIGSPASTSTTGATGPAGVGAVATGTTGATGVTTTTSTTPSFSLTPAALSRDRLRPVTTTQPGTMPTSTTGAVRKKVTVVDPKDGSTTTTTTGTTTTPAYTVPRASAGTPAVTTATTSTYTIPRVNLGTPARTTSTATNPLFQIPRASLATPGGATTTTTTSTFTLPTATAGATGGATGGATAAEIIKPETLQKAVLTYYRITYGEGTPALALTDAQTAELLTRASEFMKRTSDLPTSSDGAIGVLLRGEQVGPTNKPIKRFSVMLGGTVFGYAGEGSIDSTSQSTERKPDGLGVLYNINSTNFYAAGAFDSHGLLQGPGVVFLDNGVRVRGWFANGKLDGGIGSVEYNGKVYTGDQLHLSIRRGRLTSTGSLTESSTGKAVYMSGNGTMFIEE